MRPYAAAPRPCMTNGCPAGRDLVRLQMADPLPRHSGLADVQPRTDVDTGDLAPVIVLLGWVGTPSMPRHP